MRDTVTDGRLAVVAQYSTSEGVSEPRRSSKYKVEKCPCLLVVALVLLVRARDVTCTEDETSRTSADTGYDRRMTPEEREEIFRNMEARLNQRDEAACVHPTNPTGTEKPLPTVPKSYTTKVEIAFQEAGKKQVLYGAETVDGIFNAGVLRYEMKEGVILTRPYTVEMIIHYDLGDGQALSIITDTECHDTDAGNCDPMKICHASNLEGLNAELQDLFGFGDANGQNGYFGVGGILQWGPEYDYVYMGQTQNCRGMTCDIFQVCLTDPAEEASVQITYYWSAENWEVITNKKPVPVAVELTATGKYGHITTRKVMQRFDFYEFMRDFRPGLGELMPPADVYCEGRLNLADPPEVPYYFSYSSEAVTGFDMIIPAGDNETDIVEFTVVSTHSEHYDWESQIVATDFIPWFIIGQLNRYNYELRRVQDFNQGLEYYVMKHLDDCLVMPIENFTSAGDVIVGDHGSVSLMPPWNFDGFDTPMQYNGMHWTRGVPADVWIGLKKVWNSSFNEDFVWYFASPLAIDETMLEVDRNGRHRMDAKNLRSNVNINMHERIGNRGWQQVVLNNPIPIMSMDKVPLRLERYLNILSGFPHLIYNMYDFQSEPPMMHTIDISSCYNNTQMRSFILDLPPDSLEKVKQERDKLMYSAQRALADVAIVSPLRINKIAIEAGDNRVRLLFTVLEKSKVVGTAPGSQLESDMATAVQLIRSAVSTSQLVIVVQMKKTTSNRGKPSSVSIVAVSNSMVEVTRIGNDYSYSSSKGYQSGDMAGLAIGMLLMGALVGVAINTVMRKGAAANGGLPRVNMAHKSRLSPDSTININADLTGSDI
ncbi:uncharacterized protein [Panulirus ornatus]|uniref:uncharacterized protein isoform X2 n=1 Tax=Panulirus ornatus TaxID=150431 RepID=UPI003A87D38C